MKQFLEKLRDARTVQRNYPCIFDDSNVRSLFGMLDVTGKGFITYEQYKQGDVTNVYRALYRATSQTFNHWLSVLLPSITIMEYSGNKGFHQWTRKVKSVDCILTCLGGELSDISLIML